MKAPEYDSFLVVRETLTRIGIASKYESNTLYQSCHILQKRNRYYILSFKTLYVLDGKENDLTVGDIARQNKIIHLLQDWGLIEVVEPSQIDEPVAGLGNTIVIPASKKNEWTLIQKYNIGGSRKASDNE